MQDMEGFGHQSDWWVSVDFMDMFHRHFVAQKGSISHLGITVFILGLGTGVKVGNVGP